MRGLRQIVRSVDLVFIAGALGVLAISSLAFEAGRALSFARELKTSVIEAGDRAVASYAENVDSTQAERVAASVLVQKSSGGVTFRLKDFALNARDRTLSVAGTATLNLKVLKLMKLGSIEVEHAYRVALTLRRVASRRVNSGTGN